MTKAPPTACVTYVWAGILLGSRKNSKPENCLKMPQNPTRQVQSPGWDAHPSIHSDLQSWSLARFVGRHFDTVSY
jgi:hypothetical protein